MKLEEDIEYRNRLPFYKGMPCFVNGMRLSSTPKINEEGFLSAYYWRDGGLWGCECVELYSNIYILQDDFHWSVDMKEVKPEALEFWKESNGCYAPPCSTVEEAIEITEEEFNRQF